jgi:hypothetical protein
MRQFEVLNSKLIFRTASCLSPTTDNKRHFIIHMMPASMHFASETRKYAKVNEVHPAKHQVPDILFLNSVIN